MTRLQMKYFLKVCETGNLTDTAAFFHVSVPAVSNAIHSIEQSYGIDLFAKNGKRLAVTTKGTQFKEILLRYMDKFQNMQEELLSISASPGPISLRVCHAVSMVYFCEVDRFFSEQLGGRVRLVEEDTRGNRMDMADNVDAVIFPLFGDRTVSLDKKRKKIMTLESKVYVHKKLVGNQALSVRQLLEQYPIYSLPEVAGYTHHINQLKTSTGIKLRVEPRFKHFYVLYQYIRAGMGLGISPINLFREEKDIIGLSFPEPQYVSLVIEWNKKLGDNPPIIDEIISYFRKLLGDSDGSKTAS